MELVANTVIETLVATAVNPVVVVTAVLVGLALASGLVARIVEAGEHWLRPAAPTPAGRRSPIGARRDLS